MQSTLRYLNPIAHLGDRNYSFWFPGSITLTACLTLEVVFNQILKNPDGVGVWAIFVFVGLIIYFAFRDGLRGGLITVLITIGYYFYIMYTRNYQGERLISGVETTIVLTIIYVFLAGTIGWLKQTIDLLIEREADERRRLRAIVDQMPVGVIVTDAQGKVTQSNKQIENIMGMKIPIGYRIGKEPLLVPTLAEGKKANNNDGPLFQVIHNHQRIAEKEYTIQRKDGKHVEVHVSAAPIHNKDGKLIAAASITTDITIQRETEKRKDDFINMASHELKTPITSIKLYLDFLTNKIQKTNDERALKTLVSVKYQTEKLQDLVNDLLDVSRLQTGKLSFSYETFPLNEMIEETVDQLQQITKSKKIIYAKKQRIDLRADRFRIYQVLTNLITNAIKYSKQSTEIILEVKKNKKVVTVSVKDFGIGIPKDQQKRIFERLYQVNEDHTNTFPGLGMGLYISSQIIKRHKGKIWVESEVGKGSTFFFQLPLK